MKIVIANKYLYPRGGDCIYTLRLMDLLTKNGHQVYPFGMHHPQNIKTEYSKYFVPYINFRDELKNYSIKNVFNVVSRSIINTQAASLLEQLICEVKPDIVHLNNIHHQLTPAILRAPNKYSIPVIWTIHDGNILCPDHLFLRNGKPCRKCDGGKYYHAVFNRCKKNSTGASLLAAMECAIFNPSVISQKVNRFIFPSQFMTRLHSDNGIPINKIATIPYPLPSIDVRSKKGDYFIYVGRLSAEKGVGVLIEAFKKFNKGKLIIVGDGPDRELLESESLKSMIRNIEFVGQQPSDKVFEMLSGCLASIVPSICWDNFPYSVMEAMAVGKPVIASKTGGIPEQVEHGRTGLLFTPGNSDELVLCMERLYNNRAMAETMGKAGAQKVITEYSSETHYKNIMKVYEDVLDIKVNAKYDSRVSCINEVA